MRLTGKVAVVTGSTKGIGREIAREYAREGARVVVSGRDGEAGDSVVSGIRDTGGEAIFVRADVAVENDVQALVAAAVTEYGRLDALVNNAAAVEFIGGGGERPVTDQTTEQFEYILKVGLYGPFWACKYAIPAMRDSGGGTIVNISSIASTMGQAGVPSYTCTKAALNGLTRQIAVDYAADRIRSNAIIVGFVLSGSFAAVLAQSPQISAALDGLGLVKSGATEDIAHLATFLASDESAFLTGTLIPADGGLSVRSGMPDFSAMIGPTPK